MFKYRDDSSLALLNVLYQHKPCTTIELNTLAQVHCKQWLQYPDVLYGTEVFGRTYFDIFIRIIASTIGIIVKQIPRLSRNLHLDFQDFTGANSFSKTFQVLQILQKQFQDFQEA